MPGPGYRPWCFSVFRSDAVPAPGQPAQQQQGLIPVAIRLDMVSGYHDFGRFLNALENAEEPMAAQDVKFTPDRAEFQKLRINLTLKTFVKG